MRQAGISLAKIPSWAKPVRELAALPQKFSRAHPHCRQLRRLEYRVYRSDVCDRWEVTVISQCFVKLEFAPNN